MEGILLFAALMGLFEDLYLEPEAMAGHLLMMEGSPMALFYAPALLDSVPGVAALVSQPFGIPEITYARLAWSAGRRGVGLTALNAEGYRELAFHAGWARAWPGGTYGVAFWALQLHAGPDTRLALGLDLGSASNLSGFRIAVRVRTGLWPGWFWQSYPSRLGVSVRTGENPTLALDWELEEGYEPEWRLSGLYPMSRLLWLGTGLSLSPPQWTLLMIVPWRPYVLYAVRIHPQLGLTHTLELQWSWRSLP